jgi:hypothetical protein
MRSDTHRFHPGGTPWLHGKLHHHGYDVRDDAAILWITRQYSIVKEPVGPD